MANPKIKFKRSSVLNKRPDLSSLDAGELALNTNDGRIFIRRDTGGASGIDTGIKIVNPWSENNSQTGIACTFDVSVSGAVTATSFFGDGSNLSGIGGSSLQSNDTSISIASTDGSIVFKSSNVVVATLSSTTAYWNVPLNLNDNKIVNLADPSSLSDAANKNYVNNKVDGVFPTGDYGSLTDSQSDSFNQAISELISFDCSTEPSNSLTTTDLGALT